MTETDVQYLSLGLNVLLLIHNYIQRVRYDALHLLFVRSFRLAEAIADGKATVKRDSKGLIRIEEVKHEAN